MSATRSGERLMVVTSDTHAGPPTQDYEEYLPREFHDELRAYCARRGEARAAGATLGSGKKGFAIWKQKFLDDYIDEELVNEPGPTGGWDFDVREKELGADGCAGEVIFPGPVNVFIETSIPFQGRAFFGDAYTADSSFDAMWAGARAYNRFLADRINPATQAGLALIPTLADIETARGEIRWAADAGLKGAYVRQAEAGLPALGDERYEPLWAEIEACDLVLNFHGGVGAPEEPPITMANGANGYTGVETAFWGYRPLWRLIMAGTFDRYPNLRMVFSEVHGSWVPTMIDMLDVRWEDPWLSDHGLLQRKPSDVWRQNCGIGASFLSRAEVEMSDPIGADGLMYGNDYPHVEGIWPATPFYLGQIFSGVDVDLVKKLAGENACRMYRLDEAALRTRAQECGPLIADIVGAEVDPAGFHSENRYAARAARPSSWVLGGVPRGFSTT